MDFVLLALILCAAITIVIVRSRKDTWRATMRPTERAGSAFRIKEDLISTIGLQEQAVSVIELNTECDPNAFVSALRSAKQYVDRIIDERLDYDYALDAYFSTYFCDLDKTYRSDLFVSRVHSMIQDLASSLGPPLQNERELFAYWLLIGSSYPEKRIMSNILNDARQRNIEAEDQFYKIESRIKAAVDHHIDALARKYRQNVQHDDYGNIKTERFDREADYFFNNVVSATLSDVEREALDKIPEIKSRALKVIRDEVAAQVQRRSSSGEEFSDTMSGHEFEHLCADVLEDAGWNVRRIGGAGDQGVDLVAEGFGNRVALQCKLYVSPVGNKAVQEAFAGKKFEEADIAAVVAKGRYTRAAEELAARSGVLLLHYEDLRTLRDIIANQVPSGPM